MNRSQFLRTLFVAPVAGWAGCSLFGLGGDDPDDFVDTGTCVIPSDQIFDGGPGKDGIPALTDPDLLPAADVTYLSDNNRVVGVFVDGRAIAIPHNILWHHEIANFNFSSLQVAVTYCPLTGSSIVFDRASVAGAELGVSGLLFETNLIMYDRNRDESLFSQMSRQGSCGPRVEQALTPFPAVEMTWAGWQALFPDSEVVSSRTGHSRNYDFFPYGNYESLDSGFIFPVSRTDDRRPPKERVLGIPDGTGGFAFPFRALDVGPVHTVSFEHRGRAAVVLWDRNGEAATAFYRTQGGQTHEFTTEGEAIVDTETGSSWDVSGRAVTGSLAGTQLEPIAEAYVAFWFAWAIFQPDTQLWTG